MGPADEFTGWRCFRPQVSPLVRGGLSSQRPPLQGWLGTATSPQTASATQIAPTPSVTRFWDTRHRSMANTEVRSRWPWRAVFSSVTPATQ